MIPITKPCVGEEEARAAAEAVLSGWLSQGQRVQAFENAVAEYVGAKHAIATSNCTTALHLALLAAGVGPGDEVICPSFSFIATANAVVHAGATPVFVDIDRRTYNIDPALIEAAITPRTKAIIPVDQIGLAADIPAVAAIARKHGLRVVEDAAPSLGATAGEGRVGAAEVAQKHANYIVNLGGASSDDVLRLAELVRVRVLREFGVGLELEVQVLGG